MIRLFLAIAATIAAWIYLPWWGAIIVTIIACMVPVSGMPLVAALALLFLLVFDASKRKAAQRREIENRGRGY